ncbi:Stp1/IreP family PP2C-type Ser/Thr phosphatase [Desulfomonile tiedjei]|uniref:Serine/threonine protein phosphatase n=1 Tax=Desulfomonile tiedjei (strain ATCC 49306 / DSM 6799 / DCB-1) TaxID=706587 RepID=I4C5X0_DESTA|nr:Stp1/IreP family PP2C-type Ser/Thr phosphatase [Desulfomonile tiedjei]AFM24961.1 serine/threonine protein phosphatase [Desulfomonile tiedjei DSM 6799]
MRIGHKTVPGKHRSTNEDNLFVDSNVGLFIVADGMGGHNAGEVASRIAVDVTVKSVLEGLSAGKEAEQTVRDAFSNANRSIYDKSLNNPAWEEMGTTLLVALINAYEVIIGHIGDTRAYLIRNGRIEQLTDDHTFVSEWLKEGLITKEEARSHHARHGLTEAVGITDEVEPEVAVWPWDGNTCLLLCSDGLTDVLEDKEILAIVETSSEPQPACDSLVSAAQLGRGQDDITVILICN